MYVVRMFLSSPSDKIVFKMKNEIWQRRAQQYPGRQSDIKQEGRCYKESMKNRGNISACNSKLIPPSHPSPFISSILGKEFRLYALSLNMYPKYHVHFRVSHNFCGCLVPDSFVFPKVIAYTNYVLHQLYYLN